MKILLPFVAMAAVIGFAFVATMNAPSAEPQAQVAHTESVQTTAAERQEASIVRDTVDLEIGQQQEHPSSQSPATAPEDGFDKQTRGQLTLMLRSELKVHLSDDADREAIWPHVLALSDEILAQQADRQRYYDFMKSHQPRTQELYAPNDKAGQKAQFATNENEYVHTRFDSNGLRSISRFQRGDYPELDAIVDRMTKRMLSAWADLTGVEGFKVRELSTRYATLLSSRGIEIPTKLKRRGY